MKAIVETSLARGAPRSWSSVVPWVSAPVSPKRKEEEMPKVSLLLSPSPKGQCLLSTQNQTNKQTYKQQQQQQTCCHFFFYFRKIILNDFLKESQYCDPW